MCRLPEIQEELYKVLQQTENDLAQLPQPPSNNPLGDVLRALDDFKKEVSERVEGTPDADGLLQTIRPHTATFKSRIRGTAPNFVPWERKEAHKHSPPQTGFFPDYEDNDGDHHYSTGPAASVSKWDDHVESSKGSFGPPSPCLPSTRPPATRPSPWSA